LNGDLLRAYEADDLGSCFSFRCIEADRHVLLPGGWPELLRTRSSYFRAMLDGGWLESSKHSIGQMDDFRLRAVDIHFPIAQFTKLLHFLHGGTFVTGIGDLTQAVECGSFFGVPSLLAHANEWIATNLKVANAPNLWVYVDSEPRLQLLDSEEHCGCADADDACFDFHIRHFAELVSDPEDGDGSWVPIHDLTYPLMKRVLASGLIAMPRDALTEVVVRFVEAKTGGKRGGAFDNLLAGLRPPVVLFNRENRELLAGVQTFSIQSIL
jgi:hypothetical protein